jgi:hypothetical protein
VGGNGEFIQYYNRKISKKILGERTKLKEGDRIKIDVRYRENNGKWTRCLILEMKIKM